jgi:hypothetical protein
MIIQGTPVQVQLSRDCGTEDRFWYWRGASGRRYIHTIYGAAACPPLPGAVFVAVRRIGTLRTAVAVGRFPAVIEGGAAAAMLPKGCVADEIHVHLLARNDCEAGAVKADLALAMTPQQRPVQTAGPAAIAA